MCNHDEEDDAFVAPTVNRTPTSMPRPVKKIDANGKLVPAGDAAPSVGEASPKPATVQMGTKPNPIIRGHSATQTKLAPPMAKIKPKPMTTPPGLTAASSPADVSALSYPAVGAHETSPATTPKPEIPPVAGQDAPAVVEEAQPKEIPAMMAPVQTPAVAVEASTAKPDATPDACSMGCDQMSAAPKEISSASASSNQGFCDLIEEALRVQAGSETKGRRRFSIRLACDDLFHFERAEQLGAWLLLLSARKAPNRIVGLESLNSYEAVQVRIDQIVWIGTSDAPARTNAPQSA